MLANTNIVPPLGEPTSSYGSWEDCVQVISDRKAITAPPFPLSQLSFWVPPNAEPPIPK